MCIKEHGMYGRQEWNIIKNLKKIKDNIIITQVDKGKTVVIIPQ
jgi:hypothetical protein